MGFLPLLRSAGDVEAGLLGARRWCGARCDREAPGGGKEGDGEAGRWRRGVHDRGQIAKDATADH